MSVFVNYGGPKLDKKQKQLVRSQAMVSFRGKQKEAKNRESTTVTVQNLNTRKLAPARGPQDEEEHCAKRSGATNAAARPERPAPNSGRKRNKLILVAQSAGGRGHWQTQPANPYDLRGAPPQSTHMTGVPSRTFQDYLSRCGSYSSYLDEAFVLVGFRQPSYFRPDLSKAACIYIGYLLTAEMLDAFRGTVKELAYPEYEYLAVRELQRFIDGAGERELHEVVYPVIILGIFEMVRFSPRTVTHLAAVERFIKSRGGLNKMPIVMQHLVIMGDMLQSVTLHTTLAFNTLGSAPIIRLMTASDFLAGDQLLSCPLLLCDDEDFFKASRYVDPSIGTELAGVLQAASESFRLFFDLDAQSLLSEESDLSVDLDAIADSPTATNDVSGLFLETCALAARIMRRTLWQSLKGFDDPANEFDVLGMFDNARFIGLRAWTGLSYVYVWMNLVGFAASRDERMRSYFIAEVVRCAYSYGCYQMEVFLGVLRNFIHLRNAVVSRSVEVL